ncbi:MAG: hypothetical protein K8S97_10365, partial [Anaerolineae bacterium]|nr:hypothetical protein [Anaerolineae bacterium]
IPDAQNVTDDRLDATGDEATGADVPPTDDGQDAAAPGDTAPDADMDAPDPAAAGPDTPAPMATPQDDIGIITPPGQ